MHKCLIIEFIFLRTGSDKAASHRISNDALEVQHTISRRNRASCFDADNYLRRRINL